MVELKSEWTLTMYQALCNRSVAYGQQTCCGTVIGNDPLQVSMDRYTVHTRGISVGTRGHLFAKAWKRVLLEEYVSKGERWRTSFIPHSVNWAVGVRCFSDCRVHFMIVPRACPSTGQAPPIFVLGMSEHTRLGGRNKQPVCAQRGQVAFSFFLDESSVRSQPWRSWPWASTAKHLRLPIAQSLVCRACENVLFLKQPHQTLT